MVANPAEFRALDAILNCTRKNNKGSMNETVIIKINHPAETGA